MKKIICIILLAVGCLVQSEAQNKEELQKRQQEIQKEIDALNKELSKIGGDKKKSLQQLALIQQKLKARESLINGINREIRQIEDVIYNNEIEIYRMRKELDTLRQQYAKSIEFAYRNRSSYAYLNFLFSASSFNDAVKRVEYLKSYRRLRETQVEAIEKTQELLKERIGQLSQNKQVKTQTLTEQSKQLKVLEEDKREQSKVVKQIKDQEKDIVAQIKRREQQRVEIRRAIDAAIRREIAEAERRAKQKAAEDAKKAAAANNTNTASSGNTSGGTTTAPRLNNEPVTGMGGGTAGRVYSPLESTEETKNQSIQFENNRGRLPWPLDQGLVTIPFGKYVIPETKLVQENPGITITTKIGSSVKAIADGEVVAVMNLDEYQAVIIKHGKYFTTYNKLASANVSRGQNVKAGAILGKVAANFEGDGEIDLIIMNDKKNYLDPESWLRPRR